MEVSLWMEEQGLNAGEPYYNLADDTGKQLATTDLAWPDGIQSGLSEPVALLLGEPAEVHEVVNNAVDNLLHRVIITLSGHLYSGPLIRSMRILNMLPVALVLPAVIL